MSSRRLLNRFVMAAGFLLAAVGLCVTAVPSVADEAPKGQCCKPAYVETPSGAGGKCKLITPMFGKDLTPYCGDDTPSCSALRPMYETTIAGVCEAAAAGACMENAKTTTFEVYRGSFVCVKDGNACVCQWTKTLPPLATPSGVSDCKNVAPAGGGAPAAMSSVEGEVEYACAAAVE